MVKSLFEDHVSRQIKLALNVQTELRKVMGMFKVASGEAPHWRPHGSIANAISCTRR